MIQQPSQPVMDDYVFLIGRPPIGEFLGFIRAMAVNGHSADQGQLTNEWRKANDRVRELEQHEAGLAENPSLESIPAQLLGLKQQVQRDPILARAFRLVPTDLVMVELDKLVVYQKFINLGFVHKLKAHLGNNPTAEEIFSLALCLERNQPDVQHMQTAPNSFTFISPSTDFRFLEAVLLSPNQIQNLVSTGPATAILGLTIGYGSNYLNAVHIENRLILNNGSHRAYALRDLGVTHAPCLVQHISRSDELELTGPTDVQQNPDRYLRSPRPPLLKDYFDPLLRKIVPVQRKNRLVKLSFGVESSDIPAA